MARSVTRNIVQAVLAVVVLGIGFAVSNKLAAMKQAPDKQVRENRGVKVETITADTTRQRVRIDASGTVVPARSVVLSAEVGGRVTWMHPELLPGGRIPARSQVMRIDARDYRLAVEQQYAAVDRARTELEVERSRKKIAEREWELLGKQGDGDGGALALREPQLRTAEVSLKAAESGLERARLAVGKTALTLPFNAVVQSRNVDVGQLVLPGTPLATLIGTDEFWVQVSVPVEHLRWIDVPGVRGATTGAVAAIRQAVGDATITRTGRVVRLMGDLDPAGRMARVLVAVDDPLALGVTSQHAAGATGELPLLVGAYVDVEIEGSELAEVIELPRDALRDGTKVYVAEGAALAIREVDVVWRRPTTVLVATGLAAGDRVIVSPVPGAVPGLKLRVDASPAKAAAAPGAAEATP